MKRVLLTLLAIIMTFSLISCKKSKNGGEITETKAPVNENVYVGILGEKPTTLYIDGEKAIFDCSYIEFNNDYGAEATITHTLKLVGLIESIENGVMTVTFAWGGASHTESRIYSGEGAEVARQEFLKIADYMEGAMKQAIIDLADGKTLVIQHGDELWQEMGQGDSVITVTLDEENGSFEGQYRG